MLLVISSARNLMGRYGDSRWPALRDRISAMDQLPNTRAFLPDSQEWMAVHGLSAAPMATDEQVRAAVHGLVDSLRLSEAPSVLLLGGDATVPYCRVPNPVRDRVADPDDSVQTDYPYSLRPGQPIWSANGSLAPPRFAMGRLPEAEPPDAGFLLALLESLGSPDAYDRLGVFAVVNAQWEGSAWTTLKGLEPDVRSTPHWTTTDPEWSRTRARIFYFNLHGFADRPEWRGFDHWHGRWVDSVRPGDVTPPVARGSFVVAANCYGAWTEQRSPASSVALAFMAGGARAVVGSTGLAFGSLFEPAQPIDNADSLSRFLVQGILGGEAVGEALLRARQAFVEQQRAEKGFMTPYEQKTALEFVLFGNPKVQSWKTI